MKRGGNHERTRSLSPPRRVQPRPRDGIETLLADEAIDSELWSELVPEHRTKLFQTLVSAQKFSFEGRTVHAAISIAERRPENLLDCLPWARLPFHETWVEYALPKQIVKNTEALGHAAINKIALLYQAKKGVSQAGVIYIFYKNTALQTVKMSAYHLLFDWTGTFGLRVEQAKLFRKSAIELSTQYGTFALEHYSDVKSQDAAVRLHLDIYGAHLNPAIDPKESGWDGFSNQELPEYLSQDRDNVMGNIGMSLACILLINCRSGVVVEDVNVKCINKGRLQRKHRPYFEHKTVTLEIFKTKKIQRGTGTRNDSRAHWVMGHFKRRSTGVFWWSPHVRGDSGKGWIEKDYEVV